MRQTIMSLLIAAIPSSLAASGTASSYSAGAAEQGACSLISGYTAPPGIYKAAISKAIWSGGNHCGECYDLTSLNGTVRVMMVDRCPECESNHFDLFRDAYMKLDTAATSTNTGTHNKVALTDYKSVPCGISGNIVLKNQDTSKQSYLAIVVQNGNYVTTKFEVNDGTWRTVNRNTETGQFTDKGGVDQEKFDVRLTGSNGKTVVIKDVSATGGKSFTAGSNF